MPQLEKILVAAVFIAVFGLSLWLQYGLIEAPAPAPTDANPHDPDYYIENFTATGVDTAGSRKYVLEAERLAHYPDDDTALLDNPHIIQYEAGLPPRHTYAESGWMAPDGEEILLTGNVRVIQGQGADSSGVMTTRKMRIHLKEKLQFNDG